MNPGIPPRHHWRGSRVSVFERWISRFESRASETRVACVFQRHDWDRITACGYLFSSLSSPAARLLNST
jgi:hypothetical protein